MSFLSNQAMRLWTQYYGFAICAEDFAGRLMYRDAYGNKAVQIWRNGKMISCGWNIHHILPASRGGSDDDANLICTNISTNEEAGDRITYWIDDGLYQVHRIPGTVRYRIVRLNKPGKDSYV